MLLQQVAAQGERDGDQRLGNGRIKMKPFYQVFDQCIVQHQVDAQHHAVPEQLDPAFQGRLRKDQVFIQCKTDQVGHERTQDERGNVSGDHLWYQRKIYVNIPLVQDPVIGNVIIYDPGCGRRPAGSHIPEGMKGKPAGKRRIKKIDDPEQSLAHSLNLPLTYY